MKTTMTIRFLLTISLFAICLTGKAQLDIQFNTPLPLSRFVIDYTLNPLNYSIIVNNSGADISRANFYVQFYFNGSLIAIANSGAVQDISRGLTNYTYSIFKNRTVFDPVFEARVKRTRMLPAGCYRFCVRIHHSGIVEPNFPACLDWCIAELTPPEIYYPVHSDTLRDFNPFTLSYSPLTPSYSLDHYEVLVFEAQPGLSPEMTVNGSLPVQTIDNGASQQAMISPDQFLQMQTDTAFSLVFAVRAVGDRNQSLTQKLAPPVQVHFKVANPPPPTLIPIKPCDTLPKIDMRKILGPNLVVDVGENGKEVCLGIDAVMQGYKFTWSDVDGRYYWESQDNPRLCVSVTRSVDFRLVVEDSCGNFSVGQVSVLVPGKIERLDFKIDPCGRLQVTPYDSSLLPVVQPQPDEIPYFEMPKPNSAVSPPPPEIYKFRWGNGETGNSVQLLLGRAQTHTVTVSNGRDSISGTFNSPAVTFMYDDPAVIGVPVFADLSDPAARVVFPGLSAPSDALSPYNANRLNIEVYGPLDGHSASPGRLVGCACDERKTALPQNAVYMSRFDFLPDLPDGQYEFKITLSNCTTSTNNLVFEEEKKRCVENRGGECVHWKTRKVRERKTSVLVQLKFGNK